jgi:transcription termination/antitermination protein NusG
MFRWYVINTYSGHENKVKQNLEHRVVSLNQQRAVRQVVVPTETVQEMKDNQKVSVEKRTMPGYVLVNMDLNEDSWSLVKGTPGVTGFVGASNEPIPLTQTEVNRLLHREEAVRVPSRAQFSIGESVKVISGPLSDFSGEISEINEDAGKLKVLVSIFGRETPVEVGYDQVKKI